MKIVVKSFDEGRRSIERDRTADRGVLRNRSLIVLMVVGLGLSLVTVWALAVLAVILVVDFCVFLVRRHRLLAEYASGQPRLETPDDFRALGEAYEAAHTAEQTMSDWERAAGFGALAEWRIDLRYHEVIRVLGTSRQRVIVDVGTGDGRMAWRYGIHKGADFFIGIDVGRDLLRTLKEKLSGATAIQSEGSVLPLQDGAVDFLSCTEAFEHLSRPDRALKEFARVLRPGGRIVIQSPAATRLRNLNPLHVVQCVIGMGVPAVLQPMVVHEHTWTRTYTYHWDFTHQQLQSYCAGTGLRMVSMMCVTYRFNPNGSVLHRMAYKLSRRLPILNRLGWDMTVVFEKAAGGA